MKIYPLVFCFSRYSAVDSFYSLIFTFNIADNRSTQDHCCFFFKTYLRLSVDIFTFISIIQLVWFIYTVDDLYGACANSVCQLHNLIANQLWNIKKINIERNTLMCYVSIVCRLHLVKCSVVGGDIFSQSLYWANFILLLMCNKSHIYFGVSIYY